MEASTIGSQIKNALQVQQQLAALPAPSLANLNFGSPAPAVSAPVMPSVTMSRSVAPSPNSGDSQIFRDQNAITNLRNSGAGVDQIQNPLLKGIAKVGDIAGSVFLPGLARAIPGTTAHHNVLVGQAQQNLAQDQAQQVAQAQLANVQAQQQEREALATKAGAVADADTPAPLSPQDAAAIGHPELAGLSLSPRDREKYYGTLSTNDTHQAVASGQDQTKVTTTGMNNTTSQQNNAANNSARESISDAANKTKTLVAQMHDATSASNNANTVAAKGGANAPDGSHKVPADVTKRAALASNVTENADAVDSLINQRPDIVGAAGGRYTSVQQMIGSDDPAIAELGVRMHNIALASNGAHGVRSAQAIQQTENELFNNFKTGPAGIHAALNATRGSMSTFLNDEQNFANTGQRKPAGSGSPSPLTSPPPGATHIVPGNDGHNHYTDGTRDLGVAP